MPRTIHVAQLDVSGQTRPRAFVKAIVDTTELQQIVVADSGRYELHLPLPDVGSHLVRIEVRYGAPDNPVAEVLTRTVTRTTDPIPTPRILAVQRMVTGDSYAVVVGTVPGTRVLARGATILRDGRTRDIARGRPTIELRPDPGDQPITLQAIDDTGGMSGFTEPLDLETLSRSDLTQAPDDLTEMTVAYRIDRADVTRTQTVVLDPGRPELKDLTEGRLDTLGFLISWPVVTASQPGRAAVAW